jgi:NitT/TauT family transport system substrate-binding protein
MVERGYAQDVDLVVQTMRDMPYARWRELDAENTVRFYALRLREAGMIKSSPQKILAQGTDWRFVNELKREMKG